MYFSVISAKNIFVTDLCLVMNVIFFCSCKEQLILFMYLTGCFGHFVSYIMNVTFLLES